METREHSDEKNEKSSKKIWNIRVYTAALLMLIPSINVQSESNSKEQNQSMFASYQKQHHSIIDMNETVEQLSDEYLFKKTIAKSFGPINSLKSIPAGGVMLKYDQVPQGTYPKTVDIFPKEMIADKLPYTIIQLWEKMFVVTPDMWFEVDKISFDTDGFHVVVSMDSRFGKITKTTSKDKKSELWEYLRKLWSEGADGRYLGSTVTEISKNNQKVFLEAFNKFNK